jgi:hypothetical protein
MATDPFGGYNSTYNDDPKTLHSISSSRSPYLIVAIFLNG